MNSVGLYLQPFFHKLPRLFRLLLGILAINITLFVLFRFIFWLIFHNPDDAVPGLNLLKAFYIGFKFDLRLALLLALPLFLLGWLKWLGPFHSRLHRHFWVAYFTLVQLFTFLFYTTDFGYYAYLSMRLDATSLRFLENPLISAQMVWQTYPVIWGMLALLLITAIYTYGLARLFKWVSAQQAPVLRKRHRAWIAPLSFFVVLFGLYGKFSFYPLRWSDAFFSTHQFASAVALNPVIYFFDTLKNKDSHYDINKAREHYPDMVAYLGIQQADAETLNYRREIKSDHHHGQRPNVVMVFLESFAAFKVGAFGNPLNPTPNFDKLADDGLFFNRFFTPHTGTARSVFTAMTGIPDIELSKTSSRNPLIVKQHTIINAFKGYEKFYFLGGSANWGNIRGILAGNIPGLQIYEEGSYSADSPRIDVWGISDLHLFREAHRVLKAKQDKPFFAIIQTSGNHRPYTIPEDNMGFKRDTQSNETLKRFGFHSDGEYNSFRFMDHSVGKFIEMARREPYFNNTIFAFFGDHGLAGAGEHIPKYETQLNLHHGHVPFVIYSPGLIKKPATQNKIASEVDVLPTLAGLALPEYANTSLGRDLLDTQFDKQRYAFTIEHSRTPRIGLLGDQFYYQMYADGRDKRLYRLDAAKPRENILQQQAKIAKTMQQLCIGLYETAKYMRFNNAP